MIPEAVSAFSDRLQSFSVSEDTYNQSTIKPNILFLNASNLQNHLIDERKDGKESNRLNKSSIAQERNLTHRQRLVIILIFGGRGCAANIVDFQCFGVGLGDWVF